MAMQQTKYGIVSPIWIPLCMTWNKFHVQFFYINICPCCSINRQQIKLVPMYVLNLCNKQQCDSCFIYITHIITLMIHFWHQRNTCSDCIEAVIYYIYIITCTTNLQNKNNVDNKIAKVILWYKGYNITMLDHSDACISSLKMARCICCSTSFTTKELTYFIHLGFKGWITQAQPGVYYSHALCKGM